LKGEPYDYYSFSPIPYFLSKLIDELLYSFMWLTYAFLDPFQFALWLTIFLLMWLVYSVVQKSALFSFWTHFCWN